MLAIRLPLGLLIIGAASPALAETGKDGAVRPVASISRGRETPATARTSPSSGLSPAITHYVAEQVAMMIAGTQVFSVLPTGSMRPAFDENTILLTEPAAFADLQIGDIVVFRHSVTGTRIVHRIVERRKGGFWTKGDHNLKMDDDLVTEDNYIGRVYGILYSRRVRAPLPEPLRQSPALTAAAR